MGDQPGQTTEVGVERWLSALPLPEHRYVLQALVDQAKRHRTIRWVEVACSVARGEGDEWSDLDLGVGIADEAWSSGLEDLRHIVEDIADVVDSLEHRLGEVTIEHRRFFVQYESGVQLDLVALPASARSGLPDGSRALYDLDKRLATRMESTIERAAAGEVREWAFLAWVALANATKYLHRGSSWEAFEQLNEARRLTWRLEAVARGLPYPSFGLTTILDHGSRKTPPEMEETVAGLDARQLIAAARRLASVLASVSTAVGARLNVALPEGMEAFVRGRLQGLLSHLDGPSGVGRPGVAPAIPSQPQRRLE